ncbi:MAG: hypothetical protein IH586_01220, partial [Anaerolineaceae bacterium]|nr:hypothetical protein [Anaerolineaceae bacterium]
NPMVMFGGFHFADNQRDFTLERAMLLGWVTNTYWETNFRTHQPGGVHARYRVIPHAGGFNPITAQRAGLEAASSQPLLQHMGEPAETETFPTTGSLLQLPETLEPGGPVFTLHIKPAGKGEGIIARLYNTGDTPYKTRISSGLLQIKTAALCDLTENDLEALPVSAGTASVVVPSHQVVILRLSAAV